MLGRPPPLQSGARTGTKHELYKTWTVEHKLWNFELRNLNFEPWIEQELGKKIIAEYYDLWNRKLWNFVYCK